MSDAGRRPVRRALLSVSDKQGLVPFAQGLAAVGVELLSTGGTWRVLRDAGLAVTEVAAHTGAPELMDGRVKTLHPKIHGGILGRRGTDDAVMAEHGILAIDLVVVNLYPFAETIARSDCTFPEAIENIDIGGPTMVRAAAKNHADVMIVVDSADYESVLAAIRHGGSDLALRERLALAAFRHTAAYDARVAEYLGATLDAKEALPDTLTPTFYKRQAMRYGENPHQRAAFYVEQPLQAGTVAALEQHQGKALSFNNVADTDAALQCVLAFDDCACVIVKHANPCGVALGPDPLAAYEHAYATDPTEAAENVRKLIRAGAVGINFEDRIVGGEGLHPIAAQAERIRAIKAVAADPAPLGRTLTQLLHGAFASARLAADPHLILDAGSASLALIGFPNTPILETEPTQ